jgi:hypothetical protein
MIETAGRLYDRIRTGLEWLGSSAPRAVRDALLAEARAALARSEVTTLDKLHRQVLALARSRGTPLDGAQLIRKSNYLPSRVDAGGAAPPASRWSAASKSVPFPRRREHAPLHYPWGEEPPPRPRSSSDIVPGKPEHLLPADCRERLAACRRAAALEREAPSEARQLNGRVRYHGPDEPPEWYWPPDLD